MMGSKYDTIGKGYDSTRCADPYLSSRMTDLLGLGQGGRYLDIGCGTGNYTSQLTGQARSIIGLDPSSTMLDSAHDRDPTIDWKKGVAENIEMQSASVDGILASLTIHHWADLNKGMKEVGRLLRPQGRFVLFTSTPAQMKGYWLCHYFPRMMEDSMRQMPSLEGIENAIHAAGMTSGEREPYTVRQDLEDCFLYIGKHAPERYLEPMIRMGISSFSSLANADEIEVGLQRLQADITSRKIEEVMASYLNDLGDYLFIQATST